MRALLVYPIFPRSYWGQEHTLPITGMRAVVAPLGLVTAAALLPADWELRLVDMNVEPLDDDALRWADVVMVSAMRIQRESFHDVVRRAHALGKRVVAGGPYVTTDPDAAPDVDHIVIGEAEALLPELARALESGAPAPRRLQASARPDVSKTPVPRFDLLAVGHYNAIGVQFSRGCPFNCEFCDIIEVFGRVPRSKAPAQFLRELDAVLATGFHGAVFVVDDNFIGNKVAARRLLAEMAVWTRTHRHPFDFFTEASVNLADDDALVRGLVAADFSAVFLGIETPSREALLATQKRQNLHSNLDQAIDKLVGAGLQVMAGFIVGFDSDDETIFDRQYDFIAGSPVSMAMVGILTALPGTQLSRRLAGEGRLYDECVGDAAYRPNFATRMPEDALVTGYGRLLARLYEPRAYYRRALRQIELQRHLPLRPYSRPLGNALATAARSFWKQGVRGRHRREYWRFLAKAVRLSPRHLVDAIKLAVVAEHMVRYTFEDVLPRLAEPAPARDVRDARDAPEAPVLTIRPRPAPLAATGG